MFWVFFVMTNSWKKYKTIFQDISFHAWNRMKKYFQREKIYFFFFLHVWNWLKHFFRGNVSFFSCKTLFCGECMTVNIFVSEKYIFRGISFFSFHVKLSEKTFFSFFKNSTCDIHLECVEHISANLNTFPAKRHFSPDFFVTRFHTWKENSPGNLFFSLGLTQFFLSRFLFVFSFSQMETQIEGTLSFWGLFGQNIFFPSSSQVLNTAGKTI